MRLNISQYIEKIPASIYWGVVLLYQFIFIFQGLDFADEGFLMTLYANIFTAPQTATTTFSIWLTGIIGGGLLSIYPQGGVIMMRILGVALVTTTAYIASRTLKPYLPKWSIRLGVLLSIMFMYDDISMLCYNRVSTLIIITAISLLLKGLSGDKGTYRWLLLSGAIFALAPLARFPNILDIAFVALIPYAAYLKKQARQTTLKQLLYFVIGWIITFALAVVALYATKTATIYADALSMLADMGSSSSNSHGIITMIKKTLQQYLSIVETGGGLLFVALLAIPILKHVKGNLYYIVVTLLLALLYISQSYLNTTYIIYFIAIITTISILLNNYHNSIKILAAASILFNVIYPLGSDYGVNIAGYHTFLFTFPIILAITPQVITTLPIYSNFIKETSQKQLKYMGWGLVMVLLVLSAQRRIVTTYFDYGSRLNKTESLSHPKLNLIYTTPQRAKVVEELLHELNNHVKPNSYLIGYDNLPMLNYLTDTKPYLYGAWVISYHAEMLADRVQRSKAETGELPVIVMQHFQSLQNREWEVDKEYYATSKYRERDNQLCKFMQQNNYAQVWSNGYFTIHKPIYE